MRTLPIFLLLLFTGCKQAANKIIDTYSNGQTKTEYIYPDKSDTSKYTCNVYYETGKLKHKTEVVNGMFVGDKISYHANGVVERIERLSQPTALNDARYDCHITNYRPDGTKESEYNYVKDKVNGLATDYDSSGVITRTTDYIDGKMNGKETLYFTNGKIKSIAFVKNDTLRGYHIDFKENGDTLKWFNNGEYGVNGMFQKKWLDNGQVLTGNYGDTLRSYVIWNWFDKDNKKIKTKVDKSKNEQYIEPE